MSVVHPILSEAMLRHACDAGRLTAELSDMRWNRDWLAETIILVLDRMQAGDADGVRDTLASALRVAAREHAAERDQRIAGRG